MAVPSIRSSVYSLRSGRRDRVDDSSVQALKGALLQIHLFQLSRGELPQVAFSPQILVVDVLA